MDVFFVVVVLHQLLEAEQQVAQLQEKVQELEVCLETTRSQLREKDAHLDDQKRRERDLLTTITEYARKHSLTTMCHPLSGNINSEITLHNVFFSFCLHQHAAAGAAGP